jgi:hypothetical protein
LLTSSSVSEIGVLTSSSGNLNPFNFSGSAVLSTQLVNEKATRSAHAFKAYSNKCARQKENHQYERVNSLTNNVASLENKVKRVQLKNKANYADKVNLVKKIQVFEKNQIDNKTLFVLQKENTYFERIIV